MNTLPLLAAAGAAHHHSFPTEALVGTPFDYLWLIPALPLAGSVLNLLIAMLRRYFGGPGVLERPGHKRLAHSIAIGVMLAATAFAWFVVFPRLLGLPEEERLLVDHVWNIFTAGSLQADLAFAIDPLSMTMVLIITTVGTGIHIYSTGYMAEDPLYWKFFTYLNFFVFAMLLLVMGDNFLLMFFGWEGVGLASYLLIGFWHEDIEKAKAAMKAFVVNRFGDFGFVIGLFILFWALGGHFGGNAWAPISDLAPLRLTTSATDTAHPPPTVAVGEEKTEIPLGPTLNFNDLRNQIVIRETGVAERLAQMTLWGVPVLTLIGIFLFIGATGKSAQIPLYVWLPDAMAGPTPVSALIHAATMVTAGVYMIARLNFIYAMSPAAMTVVALVGAVTALFAATIGFFQHDIKKVLAYSTVSQLGFMFMGVGVGAFWVGVFHLLAHACFKACLFLGSGSVILGCHHEQDMRKMGGLKKYMPSTHKTYLIACLAITGAIPFAAFFSKDEILWLALNTENLLIPGWVIWAIGLLAAAGTSYYMWRSYFFTFHGEYRGEVHAGHGAHDEAAHGHGDDHDAAGHDHHGGLPHESPRSMTSVLWFLALASAVVGFLLFIPHSWGFHAPFPFDEWLAPVMAGALPLTHFEALGEAHALEFFLQFVGGVVLPAAGAYVAYFLYVGRGKALTEKLAMGADIRLGPVLLKGDWYQPVHQFIYDKYRVDELYEMTVVRGSIWLARALAFFDKYIVDGIVNVVGYTVRVVCEIVGALDVYLVDGLVVGVARALLRSGRSLKRAQSVSVRAYLYTVLGGALAIILVNYVLFSA